MHTHSHGSHSHGSGDAHSRVNDRKALATALALILGFMVVEVGAGIAGHSLALLADAGHMLTDAAALAAALIASRLASRPARGVWTFGFGRAEILAAQANGITLLLLGVWITYSAVRRLIDPPAVHGGIVLVVALVGIAVNLAATFVLARADRSSLNVQGAFLHIATDLAAFVGTAIAGGLVLLTGWNRFDPIAGLLIAVLLVRSSWTLIRDSGRIFLEAAPAGIDPDDVARAIVADPDVAEVHDLHIWTVTSGFPALAAHVLVAPGADCHDARRRLQHLLEERFQLQHTTLQVDHLARRSQDVPLDTLERR
jgi:cobalt-zinc-cadmium efflux system protein